MKKIIGCVVSFFAVYIVFLVATAPASLLNKWGNIPDEIIVDGISGTVWSSKIKRVDVQGISINDIDTRLSALSLLTLSPSINTTFGGALAEGPNGKATIDVSGEHFLLTDASIELPASIIAPYIQAPIPIDAFGLVQVSVAELDYQSGQCSVADGEVTWQRAAVSALDQEVNLGSLTGVLSCEDQLITLTILPKNNLGLSFKAQLTKRGLLKGKGFVKPGAKFPTQLKEALMFLGKPDNQGRYQVFM